MAAEAQMVVVVVTLLRILRQVMLAASNDSALVHCSSLAINLIEGFKCPM